MTGKDPGLAAARRRMAADITAGRYRYLQVPMEEPAGGGDWLGEAGRYEYERRYFTAAANDSEALGHADFAEIHRAKADEATARRNEAQRAAIAESGGA